MLAKLNNEFHEEEFNKLQEIFKEVDQDPNWFEDSILYELYSNRIGIEEFLGLLVSDSEWSYIANKQQTKKVISLFDKVYGFVEGMSRLKQQ